MKITTKKWDASEYLDSPEMIREYLKAACEDGDSRLLITAIGNVAKAQGMTEISRKTNLRIFSTSAPTASASSWDSFSFIPASCRLILELSQ